MTHQKQNGRTERKEGRKEVGRQEFLGLADFKHRNCFTSVVFWSCCHGFSHWYIGQIFSYLIGVVFIYRWERGLKMMVLTLFCKCPDYLGLKTALGSWGPVYVLTTRRSIEKINWKGFLYVFIIQLLETHDPCAILSARLF